MLRNILLMYTKNYTIKTTVYFIKTKNSINEQLCSAHGFF